MTEPVSYTHDGGDFSPVPFRVVASWPAPAFVENVAVGPDGSVFVTVYSSNRIDLAAVTETEIVSVEIKSSRDVLDRL